MAALLMTVAFAGCATPDSEEAITIGSILPLTGTLSTFGPDMQRGVELAVQDVNDAGGLMNQSVELVNVDSKTDPADAPQAFQQLVQSNAVGVVGAASSGVTGSILGTAVDNGIVLVSPASTAPGLIDRPDDDLFFRVVPNDKLQGKVMAQLLSEDGIQSVATLYVDNDYGQGFSDVLQEEFTSQYNGTVTDTVAFADDASTFDAEVQQAASGDPDAIVYVGYPGNGVPIMRQAWSSGVLPDTPFYFSEGVFSQSFVEDVGETEDGDFILAGMKGTTPEILLGEAANQTFQDRFESTYGDAPGLFAAQSYDAAAVIALAIASAGSDDPAEFKDHLVSVWNAPGQTVTDLQEALEMVNDGQEIDYNGPSGSFELSDAGEPVRGTYGIWQVGQDGQIEVTERGITKSLE